MARRSDPRERFALVDYRDRASVLIWVVLMGLAAQRFLTLPTRIFTTGVLGSPITISITTNTILGVLLAGLVASGTEAVLQAHPRSRYQPARLPQPSPAAGMGWLPQDNSVESGLFFSPFTTAARWVFWALPIALVVVALLLLPVAPSSLYWLVGVILTGMALGLSLAGIYSTVDPFAIGYRRARLGLNALTYTVAVALFLVVYRTRVRSIVSATEVTLVSGLLALELLRGSERPVRLVVLYAGITGLLLGQATWALNYWRLDSVTGGLVLLLLFYNIVGLSQNGLQGPIRRRVLIEHGLISLAALAFIWEFAP